jgi:hypothetical protein
VAVRRTAGWSFSVLLALSLTTADASSVSPGVLVLPTGATEVEIQHALDSLSPTGGEVVLPTGQFEIHNPIVLQRDNQTLRGAGPETVLHLADDANCPVIILGEPINSPTRTIRHLSVTGFFIDGNRAHQNREIWRMSGEGSEIHNNGITVQRVSDSRVEDVVIARCRSGGLVTTRSVHGLAVRGLESFDNEFDGLACYETTDCVFTDLKLHDNPGAGISLDLAFDNNTVSNAVLAGNDLGIFMRASRQNSFLNVAIQNSHHYGVFMAHTEQATAAGWVPQPQSECTRNSFTNLLAINCGGAAFRVNNNTCTNNILIRPNFAGNTHGGLSLAQPNLITLQ